MDLVGAQEIAKMLGVTRQRVHIISRRKGFPDPVAVLAMGSVWLRADVQKWIEDNRPASD